MSVNKMFFGDASPSKLCKGRKSELLRVAKTVVSNVLGLIHPRPERVLQLLFDKNTTTFDENKLKNTVQKSITFQKTIEAYRTTTNKAEKNRLLTILKPDLTWKELSEFLGVSITWYRYRLLSHHVDVWGPGADNISLPFTGLKFSRQEIDSVLEFILQPKCIQNLAYGEKRIVKTDGTEVFLPNFQRIYDAERLWKMYQNCEEKIAISRSTFLGILSPRKRW